MIVTSDTKIGVILKARPEALEAIVSLSPHFTKLRNPLLRKIMASRATIKMACQISGCRVEDFSEKLKPFGFTFEKASVSISNTTTDHKPTFMQNLNVESISELDVRPVIDAGKDPFKLIMGKINELKQGQIFKLINSFEPMPLIELLEQKGFKHHVEHMGKNYVVTYFDKGDSGEIEFETPQSDNVNWNEALRIFEGKIIETDVRQMEMPMPMHTIIQELDRLPDDHALFVFHKRVPVFLLPELKERKFNYRIREISDTEVHLLIFKKQS
ncbi:MAG: DUF2249 domain-containing protein [Bacteroidetes bacterium]|nr:DUF2249 domain-containing protein [Bacteroidota bacterium]